MNLYMPFKRLLTPFIRLVFRMRITGRENEPLDRPYVIIANHTSFADPLLLAATLRRKQRFLAKQALRAHWWMRALFRVFDVLPVQAGGNNLLTFRAAIRTLREGGCIALFPQGTRMPYQAPQPEQAMGGVIPIASGAKADILPVSFVTASEKAKPFRKTLAVVGKPIPYEAYRALATENGAQAAAASCFAAVCKPIDAFRQGEIAL